MAEDTVESAEIKGMDLVVQTAEPEGKIFAIKLNVRDIANTELVHDTKNFYTVRAFVGVRDSARRPLFAPRTVERQFVGVVTDEQTLEQVRESFKNIGAPVIEY